MLQCRFTYFEWLVRATARAENAIFHKGNGLETPSSEFSGLRMRDGNDFFVRKLGVRWTQPPQSVGNAVKPTKSLKNSWPAPALV